MSRERAKIDTPAARASVANVCRKCYGWYGPRLSTPAASVEPEVAALSRREQERGVEARRDRRERVQSLRGQREHVAVTRSVFGYGGTVVVQV